MCRKLMNHCAALHYIFTYFFLNVINGGDTKMCLPRSAQVYQVVEKSRTSLNRYLVNQGTDEFGLKNVTERNPIQEAQKGLQRSVDKLSILGVFLEHSRREQCPRSSYQT